MSIQTVTTILTNPETAASHLRAATAFARANDAHLHVLALAAGLDQWGVVQTSLDAMPTGVDVHASLAKAKELGDLASAQLREEDIRWHVDPVSSAASGSVSEITRHTRFSDLVILERGHDSAGAEEARALAETVLFHSGNPLLLLPSGSAISAPASNIMVCWDESDAALRAARQAMPLLVSTPQVHVVLVDPPKDAKDRSDPGGAFAQYLARHGVKTEVSVCNRTDESVAATLHRHAEELGCEMIVMGAYGHSRLREAIFGGTTRDMIRDASLPVLMAH